MRARHLARCLNLLELAERGYWFCRACQRVTELNMDGPVNACHLCGSSAVSWMEPVFGEPINHYENSYASLVVDLALPATAWRSGEPAWASARARPGA